MADQFFGNTDVGRQRSNNEDAFIAEVINGFVVACVIDGVGGYEGGEVAAEIAKEAIKDHLKKQTSDLSRLMKMAIIDANEKIYNARLNTPGKDNMACVLTLAVVDIENNQLYYAHVGDTRLYLFRDQSLVKITKDHSFVGFLEDSKRLSEQEAMKHPKRNEINKALGFDPQISMKEDYIEVGQSPFLPNDVILLCSDGLTDLVSSNSISDILNSGGSLQDKTNTLIAAANEKGGKDNITVVLVQNTRTPARLKVNKAIKKKHPHQQQAESKEEVNQESKSEYKRKRNAAVPILSFLCIAFMAAAAWFWWQGRENSKPTTTVLDNRNEGERKLSRAIDSASGFLAINDSIVSGPLLITDSILLVHDSLHINGNGLIIRADSSYMGPALFATNARFLLLENITFENFQTAVIAPAMSVQLRNVRFVNCKSAVVVQYNLPPNVPLSGYFMDTLLNSIDTTYKTGMYQ